MKIYFIFSYDFNELAAKPQSTIPRDDYFMFEVGTKINHFTISHVERIDNSGNKVYACVCEQCSKKKWLGKPVFYAHAQNIENLRCWCDRKFRFSPSQRETLVKRNLATSDFTLYIAPASNEEWHRESEVALKCKHDHVTFNKVGKIMFDKPKCDVCEGIAKKKPKHLAIQIISEFSKKNDYIVKQVSGWAGNSTQYQVTCKKHGNFDLSLTRIKSNTCCSLCNTYKKSPVGL